MSTGKHYYIEQTDEGRYAVRAKGSQRASDIVNTQRQAIERAKELNPNDRPDVERVRIAKVGGRIQVHLDPDVEALLKEQARDRSLDFDRVLNEAVRAGISSQAPAVRSRFIQPTYHLGSDRLDITKALALAAELEDKEIVRKLKSREER